MLDIQTPIRAARDSEPYLSQYPSSRELHRLKQSIEPIEPSLPATQVQSMKRHADRTIDPEPPAAVCIQLVVYSGVVCPIDRLTVPNAQTKTRAGLSDRPSL